MGAYQENEELNEGVQKESTDALVNDTLMVQLPIIEHV